MCVTARKAHSVRASILYRLRSTTQGSAMNVPNASNTHPGDVYPFATNFGQFSRALQRPLAGLAFAALALLASPAWGQFVSLGTAESFAILGSSTVTNTGPSVVTGDLGVPRSRGHGFPPGTVIGTIHSGGGVASGARTGATTAYNTLASSPRRSPDRHGSRRPDAHSRRLLLLDVGAADRYAHAQRPGQSQCRLHLQDRQHAHDRSGARWCS